MKFIKFFLLCFFFLLVLEKNSISDIINSVEIKGNKQISINTILNKVNYKKGKNYSEIELNDIQKKLFQTGFFKNINFKIVNNILIINVKENPIVDFLYVYGDKNQDRIDKIYDSMDLKSGNLFSDFKLLNDINKISDIYKFNGYYNVKITPTVKFIEDNKVNIAIKIEKNDIFKINRIYFLGDKIFKPSVLLDEISSSESTWFKFLSTSSLLNESRIDYDKNLLNLFYKNEGYFDVQITSAKIDILDNNSANIIYSINAGPKYNFGEVFFNKSSFLSKIDLDYLQGLKKKIDNRKYSRLKIINLKNKISDLLIANKYEGIDLQILETKVDDKINVNISFNNKQLPVVRNILVKGNTITEEKVIRNNLSFSEGDAVSDYKISKSEDNLSSIGIFKNNKISKINLDQEIIDIEINVEEQPTGSIMGGVGAGTNGAAISFALNEKNFLGSNITANADLTIGTDKIFGNLGFSNPDFNDTGRYIRNNFFIQETNYDSVGYDSKLIGNDISTRYYIYEDVIFNFGVGFDYDKIKVNSSTSEVYKSQEGNFKDFKSFYGVSSDKRNRKFNTTDGHLIGFKQLVSLPMSDLPYISNNLYGKYYHSFSKDYVLNFRTGINSINGYNNDNVKLSNRLFLSNRQLRGFEPRGIGPLDGTDHVGGNYSLYGGLSSTFPNPLPEKWNASTILFIDAGNVWGVDYDSNKDSDKIRSAFGVGLDWFSPLGPLTFSLSNTISKASTDNEQNFSFQIGSTF